MCWSSPTRSSRRPRAGTSRSPTSRHRAGPGARGRHGQGPALVEVILSNPARSCFRPGLIIAEHRLGVVIANAGVDHSNVPGAEEGERVLLLPQDPDASSAVLRDALQARFEVGFAVVVSDSVGRAWRNGIVGLALGAAGCGAARSARQARPRRPSAQVTQVGLADEIASAAQLLMGEADEGRPAVLVRGLAWDGPRCRRRPSCATLSWISSDERRSARDRVVRRHRRRQARARSLPAAASGLPDGGVQHRRRLRASRPRISPDLDTVMYTLAASPIRRRLGTRGRDLDLHGGARAAGRRDLVPPRRRRSGHPRGAHPPLGRG